MIVVCGYRHPLAGFKVIAEIESDDAGEWLEAAYFDLTCKAWEDFGPNEKGQTVLIPTRDLVPIVTFDQNLEHLLDRIVGHDRRWFNRPRSMPRTGA